MLGSVRANLVFALIAKQAGTGFQFCRSACSIRAQAARAAEPAQFERRLLGPQGAFVSKQCHLQTSLLRPQGR
jgi:hypothetical protein